MRKARGGCDVEIIWGGERRGRDLKLGGGVCHVPIQSSGVD